MTRAPSKTLLLPIHHNSLQVLTIVAEAMAADGRLHPMMVLTSPKLEQNGRALLPPGQDALRLAESAPRARPAGLGTWGRLGLTLAPVLSRFRLGGRFLLPGLEVVELMQGLVRDYARSLALLQRERPRVVVLADDRKFGLNMAFLKAAREMGCLTILVPVALAHCRDAVPINRQEEPIFQLLAPGQRLAKAWIARRLPGQVYHAPEGPYLFFTPAQTLAMAALGMLPRNPWCMGGGDTDLVAVTGESDRRRYIRAGVSPQKLVVTDDPNLDPLHRSWLEADGLRRTLTEKYALDPSAPFLVCAVPQLAEHHVLPWEQHWRELRWLVATLAGAGYNLLLSLHPKSDPAQYQWAREEFGVPILAEPLREVLPAAEVFVSGFSSTVRWACLLHIPTVVLDLYGLDHHYFDRQQGIQVVRRREDLAPLLVRLREDKGFYGQMKEAQAQEARDLAPFEGRACQNIIEAILKGLEAKDAAPR